MSCGVICATAAASECHVRCVIQLSDDNDWLEEIAFKEALKKLSDREKRILSLRYMRGKTQMEVAEEIGISQAQVSRIEKGAIDSIKREL